MECLTRGFHEKDSKSIISCTTGSHKNRSSISSDNLTDEEDNQNIPNVFEEERLIEKYLESVVAQNKKFVLLKSHKTLLRRDHETLVGSVKLLSGGATTSDPLFSGSLGLGMLTGAVYGKFKKSPPSLTILEVLRVLSRKNSQGILVIVMNNLANRLNFGAACQSAAREGIKTLLINVGEDVSGVSVNKTIGRRGLCGIKFLFKIAGAMSEEKRTLQEIHYTIEQLKGNCLGSLNVQIRPDVMAIGPGCKGDSEKLFFLWDTFDDIGETARLSYIVKQALSHLFHPSSYFSLRVARGDQIAVIVNNLGDLSDFYLSLIIKEILNQIKTLGITVMRIYSGRFLNSNLTGFTISVLKIKDERLLELLDRPVDVTSWTQTASPVAAEPKVILELPSTSIPYTITPGDKRAVGPKFTKQEATFLLGALPNIIKAVQNMERYLNKLDNDHEFGTAITKFGKAIETEIDNRSLKISTPYEFLEQVAYLAGSTLGGIAGGVFNIIFSSAAQVFLGTPPVATIDLAMWVEAALHARDGLQKFTRIHPGDAAADAADGSITESLDPSIEHPTDRSVSKRRPTLVSGAEGATTTRTSTRGPRTSIRGPRTSTKLSVRLPEATTEGNVTEVSPRTPDPGALCLAFVIRTIFTTLQTELADAETKSQLEVETEPPKKKEGKDQRGLSRWRDDETKRTRTKEEGALKRDEDAKHGTKLGEEGRKHKTKLKQNEPKKAKTVIENELQRVRELKGEVESRHFTTLQREEPLPPVHVAIPRGDETEEAPNSEEGGSKLDTKLKEEGSRHATKVQEERSKHDTSLQEEVSKHNTKLKEGESKLDTNLKDKGSEQEGSRHNTKLKEGGSHDTSLQEEVSKHNTKLKEGGSNYDTKLKDEGSEHESILIKEGSWRETKVKEEGSTHDTKLKEGGSTTDTKLKDEGSEHESMLMKEGSSHETKVKEEGSKHDIKLEGEELTHKKTVKEDGSEHETKVEGEGSKHDTELEDKGSLLEGEVIKLDLSLQEEEAARVTELSETESNLDKNLQDDSKPTSINEDEEIEQDAIFEGEKSRHVTQLTHETSKHGTEMKVEEYKLITKLQAEQSKHNKELIEEEKEKSIKLEDLMSHLSPQSQHSHLSHHTHLSKETPSETFLQLQQVVEEIAQEIENEITDEIY